MKLFGIDFGPKKPSKPRITENDREWVNDNFSWLTGVFGSRYDDLREVTFKPEYFLEWTTKTDPESLVTDFCFLYNIPRDSVSLSIFTDLRDDISSNEVRIQGDEMDMSVESQKDEASWKHTVYISNSAVKRSNHLLFQLAMALVKIQLAESETRYDEADDTRYFIYLAAVFMGLGYLIAPNMFVSQRSSDGVRESKFTVGITLPVPILGYALALEHYMRNKPLPAHISAVASDIRFELELCHEQLVNEGFELSQWEREAEELFKKADEMFSAHHYDAALKEAEALVELFDDSILLSDAYNMIGYAYLLTDRFEESLEPFNKSQDLDLNNAYPLTNAAYSFVKMGKIESAEKLLEIAPTRSIHDPAYIDRTWALIHYANKDFEKAESFFQSSFEKINDWVDLLEYDYAIFLLETGRKTEAIDILQLAEGRGEPKVLALLKELQND